MGAIITLHTAYVDLGTPSYDEVSVATLAGYTGYSKYDLEVLGAWKKTILEGETITYIDKEIRGMLYMRHTFDPQLAPFTYHPSSWDISNYNDVEDILYKVTHYQQAWIELTQIGTFLGIAEQYHTAGNAIPVRLMGLGFEDSEGSKKIILNFQKTWVRNS